MIDKKIKIFRNKYPQQLAKEIINIQPITNNLSNLFSLQPVQERKIFLKYIFCKFNIHLWILHRSCWDGRGYYLECAFCKKEKKINNKEIDKYRNEKGIIYLFKKLWMKYIYFKKG
jgi:hypothetical protein